MNFESSEMHLTLCDQQYVKRHKLHLTKYLVSLIVPFRRLRYPTTVYLLYLTIKKQKQKQKIKLSLVQHIVGNCSRI